LGSKAQLLLKKDGQSKLTEADGQADKAPYLNFNDDKVKFNTNNRDNANENYGMLSCWLPPKCLLKKEVLKTPSFSSLKI